MDSDFLMFQKLLSETAQEKDVFARFYDRPVKTDKIGKNGMPVIENRTFVEIKMTNNTTEVYDQPATEDKVRRFPVEYQRYKLAQKQSAEGTPLEMFAFLDAAEIESLKMRGIFTVEALAALGKETAEKLDIIENSDKIEIMIIDDDPQLENQLTQKLSYELKTSSVASAVENDFVFTTPMLTSVKNDADKYGVSYSKMSLVNEANTLRNIPIREAVSMSTQQLIDHVYGYSESKINIFQNNVTSDFIAFNKQCSTAFSDLDTIAAMLEKDNCDEADYRYMENTLRQIAMFHMIFADIINIDTISHDITDGVDVFLPKLNNFNHQQKAMEAQLVLEYKSQLLNKMQS